MPKSDKNKENIQEPPKGKGKVEIDQFIDGETMSFQDSLLQESGNEIEEEKQVPQSSQVHHEGE